jgi:hypothetical protein
MATAPALKASGRLRAGIGNGQFVRTAPNTLMLEALGGRSRRLSAAVV